MESINISEAKSLFSETVSRAAAGEHFVIHRRERPIAALIGSNELERQGSPLVDLDLQIASIALENDLPLVTHNQRHFSKIKELQLLDWIA